jgi:hypothetical protein
METQAEIAATPQGQDTDILPSLPLDAQGAEQALQDGLKIASGQALEPEVTPPTEEPPGEQQPSGGDADAPPPPEPTVDPATGKVLPNRISTAQFSGDEQEAIKLRKELRDQGQDVTLKEALELVEDRNKKSQSATPPPTENATTTNPETELRAQLADIEKKLDAAAETELFTKEVRDLMDQKSKLSRDLEKFEEAKVTQQAQIQQERLSAREKVKQDVLQVFPSANDPSSPLGKEVAALIAELKDESHPDHLLLFSERAPKLVTQEAAERLAARMAENGSITVDQALAQLRAPKQAPSSNGSQASQPKGRVNPASGSSGPLDVGTPVTEKELMSAVTANPALADELLGAKSGGWIIQ